MPSLKFLASFAALLLSGRVLGAGNDSSPLYKDPTANIEDRVNDLIGRMTVEEKVAQM
jgi:beta-glucosidase